MKTYLNQYVWNVCSKIKSYGIREYTVHQDKICIIVNKGNKKYNRVKMLMWRGNYEKI
jgi:hypothetical protein